MRAPFVRHVISTFGITIIQQFVGLARQILIAAYFGLSRGYDQYLVVYAVASMVVFNTASVFDTVAVSRLVRIREDAGGDAFWRSSNRLLLQAMLGGLLFAAGLVVFVHLLMPIIAAGFAADERVSVAELTIYFAPWVLVIIPYYAVSAHLKSLWDFHWVFGAETVAMVVSVLVLWRWHDSVACLPVAFGSGYIVAAVMLFLRRGLSRPKSGSPQGLLRGMANQHLANQLGTAAGFVDRYFQSFLASGGISTLGYTGMIVNNLSSLMTFREIYVVPLSSEVGRDEKLQRMLHGIVLISIPCTIFVAEFARPLVTVLFQRGQFTPEAAILTRRYPPDFGILFDNFIAARADGAAFPNIGSHLIQSRPVFGITRLYRRVPVCAGVPDALGRLWHRLGVARQQCGCNVGCRRTCSPV